MRKQFKGIPSINPITGRIEPQFGFSRRLIRYLQSVFFCMPWFLAAFAAQIFFLNLTGIITPSHVRAHWLIPSVANLAIPGAWFDVKSNMAILVSIFQSVVVMTLNTLFSKTAVRATERENHRT